MIHLKRSNQAGKSKIRLITPLHLACNSLFIGPGRPYVAQEHFRIKDRYLSSQQNFSNFTVGAESNVMADCISKSILKIVFVHSMDISLEVIYWKKKTTHLSGYPAPYVEEKPARRYTQTQCWLDSPYIA